MPAATNKEELLAVHDKDWAKLKKLLAPITDAQSTFTATDDPASIRDIAAHRAHWIGLFFGWYESGQKGEEVETPAPGYKWNQLKAYNAMLRETYADMPWDEARSLLAERADKLRAFIADTDDKTLYTPRLYPWLNDWTLGRWAEASGASAFRSAAKYIRKALRENG